MSEVESALHVLDAAILVISSKEGVQSQTRLIFRKLQELQIPTIIFANKLDRTGVNFDNLLFNIKKQLSERIVVLQKYDDIGESEVQIKNMSFDEEDIQNQILYYSDALMEKYDEVPYVEPKEYESAFMKMAQNAEVYPVLGGVSLKNTGVTEVLDLLTKIFEHSQQKNGRLSAYVYKVDRDQKGHKRSFFRVFSGTVNIRDTVKIKIKDSQKTFLVSNLSACFNNKVVSAKNIDHGDIGIIFDGDDLNVGCIIGENNDRIGKVELKSPLLETSIETETSNERYKLLDALIQLSQEDPYLRYEINRFEEIKLCLFGPLQMEIIKSLLSDRFGINVQFSELSIVYKEQPVKKGYCSMRLRENHPYNAGAVMLVEPLPLGSGFQYENMVSYGYLEKPFQNAVLEGIRSGLGQGINGHEVIDVKVTFLEADYDSVLGTPSDFRKLVPIVIQKALLDAGVRILEPWQNFSIIVPKFADQIVWKDLCKMNAVITEYDYGIEETRFSGRAMLCEIMNYESVLNTFTEGRGIITQEFYKFLPMKEDEKTII